MNKTLKQAIGYGFWTLLSFIIAFVYMGLITGLFAGSSSGLKVVLDRFYFFGMLPVVLIIGAIIALLYILTDVFYIKTTLAPLPNKIAIRLSFLLFITLVVFFCHYNLEKVIDII